MLFRESIADRLSPARRGRGFVFATETLFKPQNSRDLLLVLACFILIFLSRIVLAPHRRGFPFWQEPIAGPRVALVRKDSHESLRVSASVPLSPAPERGFIL
jgi:hypothetical protein